MSIFRKRTAYKPFSYPWAFEYYQLQNQMHWIPEEVTLHDDVKCWNKKLSKEERHLITQIFRFFTQGDVDVANCYIERYMPNIKPIEIRMMMAVITSMEANHVNAYSLLLDTIGMPEVEYQAFMEYKAMADKHDYLNKKEFDIPENPFNKEKPSKRKVAKFVRAMAKNLAAYSGFTEGVQLFSSFAILMNFQRTGKMINMCKIVEWSIKDESLHVEAMSKLFRELIKEHPEVMDEDFENTIYEIAETMIHLEDHFIDLAFELGGISDLTPEDVKKYVRFIANKRLEGLTLKPLFKAKENPLPWLDWVVNGESHTNFFEQRSADYSKGATKGSWGDVWGNKGK